MSGLLVSIGRNADDHESPAHDTGSLWRVAVARDECGADAVAVTPDDLEADPCLDYDPVNT